MTASLGVCQSCSHSTPVVSTDLPSMASLPHRVQCMRWDRKASERACDVLRPLTYLQCLSVVRRPVCDLLERSFGLLDRCGVEARLMRSRQYGARSSAAA